MKSTLLVLTAAGMLCQRCSNSSATTERVGDDSTKVRTGVTSTAALVPTVVTDTVAFDTDDPAIWINPDESAQSLVIGTDKNENGGLYVFDLNGRMLTEKTVRGLKRPDNVDVEYGLKLDGKFCDIAVTTERITHRLRVYRLPDMKPLDDGGLSMFDGEKGDMFRDLMGIALYKNPVTGEISAVVGRKNGPTDETYLWQYKLTDSGHGTVHATLLRKFGKYSGKKEIEAIAIDDELGYVYYSDEGVGVRKYHADPARGNAELALFATKGFAQDHEGISLYRIDSQHGYILVSDQQANQFFIYPREGTSTNPNEHPLLKVVKVSALESDGSETTSTYLNATFQHGMFVVMSTDKTFHYYKWEDIAGDDLKTASEHRAKAN